MRNFAFSKAKYFEMEKPAEPPPSKQKSVSHLLAARPHSRAGAPGSFGVLLDIFDSAAPCQTNIIQYTVFTTAVFSSITC